MPSVQETNAQRALTTYGAMQRWLYIAGGRSRYREDASTAASEAFLWPFSRALQGTLALAGIPTVLLGRGYAAEVRDRLAGLNHYWDGRARVPAYASSVRPLFGRGGDKYHDDNAWVALALVQLYRMGLTDALDRPAQLFAFAQSGLDRRVAAPAPGGVFWVQQGAGNGLSNHDRGAGASAGNGMLGLHLHELTRSGANDSDASPPFLDARSMVAWVGTYLDSSSSGRGPFWNLVREDGSIDTNIWSYNQGVVIGARLLQYRISHDSALLSQAERIARQTLTTFGDFTNQPPSFNAMCFQSMLMLHALTADSQLQADMTRTMLDYAGWTWDAHTGARDVSTNLFRFDDAGRPAGRSQPAKLQDQGALVQLYSLLAWDAADYPKLA